MAIVDKEVDEFLEHFGVMGMHWGVRNKSNSNSNKNKAKLSNKKKVVIGVSAATIAIGAVFAARLLKHKLNSSQVIKSANIGKKIVDEWEINGGIWDSAAANEGFQGPGGTAFRGMSGGVGKKLFGH